MAIKLPRMGDGLYQSDEERQTILRHQGKLPMPDGTFFRKEDLDDERPIADGLTRNDRKILAALKALGATCPEKRRTRNEITKQANTGHYASRHNKTSFAHLKELFLIDAGRNSGTWITPKGETVIS
jgi:hypothetical protein